MSEVSFQAFKDAVTDAAHRLKGLGYSMDDTRIYVSPKLLVEGSDMNTTRMDSIMGMRIVKTPEIPDDIVVAIACPHTRRMIEFARIDEPR